MSAYELVAVLAGVVSVWLIARENVWGWPIGLINVGLFIVVFREAKLYADMGLQVVYVVLCLYGWHAWLRGGPEHDALTVSRAPARVRWALAAGGIAATLIIGTALHRHTDASIPFADAATTSFSLVAQWMQTRKWIENWGIWIAVDVVYVGMYVFKGLYPTAALYTVFLGLAVMGWRYWQRALPTDREPITPA
jgi:nicotinamide mononucleotide transporter